jgi:hypothetical protein
MRESALMDSFRPCLASIIYSFHFLDAMINISNSRDYLFFGCYEAYLFRMTRLMLLLRGFLHSHILFYEKIVWLDVNIVSVKYLQ